ncbi:MAG TPA: hypothetical protein VN735_08545 [Steroidobacteraceae bacterium]|nr:hypothetical protein [Steroidobacteraceae bacterium]
MIAQIWRGRTRDDDRNDFTNLLQARIQAEVASSSACRGAYVLQRQIEGGQAESLVLTLYDPTSLGGSKHEQTPQPSPPSDKEARLLLGCDLTSARYDVIIDPQRALLYAELRRRFPLRFAGPR